MTIENLVHNKSGRLVGRIDSHIFIKEVYGSKHMLHKPMAWAIDADIFDRVINHNCYSIHIIDRETGTRYITGVATFREHKQVLDRGHGKQYFLELVHWQAQ